MHELLNTVKQLRVIKTALAKKKKYSFMAFRPAKPMSKRVRAIAKAKSVSISDILNHCLTIELPRLEAELDKKTN